MNTSQHSWPTLCVVPEPHLHLACPLFYKETCSELKACPQKQRVDPLKTGNINISQCQKNPYNILGISYGFFGHWLILICRTVDVGNRVAAGCTRGGERFLFNHPELQHESVDIYVTDAVSLSPLINTICKILSVFHQSLQMSIWTM